MDELRKGCIKIIEEEFNICFIGQTKEDCDKFIWDWLANSKFESFFDMLKRRNAIKRCNQLQEELDFYGRTNSNK